MHIALPFRRPLRAATALLATAALAALAPAGTASAATCQAWDGTPPPSAGPSPEIGLAALPPAELAMGGARGTTSCGTVANGQVAFTTPAAGSNVDIGTSVILNVCNTATTVPNVLSFDDTSARNAIAAAGLIASVTMTASCTASRGTVLTQNPQGETAATRGDTVRLTESTGKQPNGKTCPIA
jgi:hypothetical protein